MALPPKASFLGIPAELRLQIYTHLFTSTHEAWYDSQYPDHLGESLTPALLRANRQIFAEAMPVLYAVNEINVQIAACDHEGHFRVQEGLQDFPRYAFEHITSIYLIPDSPRWSSSRYWFHSSLGFEKDDWEYLRTHLPDLKSLRLQMQVAKGDLKYVRYSVFEHLATLPKLENVEVLVFCDERFYPTTDELNALAVELMSRVHRKAAELGKKMTVRAMEVSHGDWHSTIS